MIFQVLSVYYGELYKIALLNRNMAILACMWREKQVSIPKKLVDLEHDKCATFFCAKNITFDY